MSAGNNSSGPGLRDDLRERHHVAETRSAVIEGAVHTVAHLVGGAAGGAVALLFGTGTAGGPGDSGPWEYKSPPPSAPKGPGE